MAIEARRHSPRVKLDEGACINFDFGNRALVLDVSEGGLGFETQSPLDTSGEIRLIFNLSRENGALASVAWMDETRTRGGFRFSSVPPEVRFQIRSWVDQSGFAPQRVRVDAREITAKALAPAQAGSDTALERPAPERELPVFPLAAGLTINGPLSSRENSSHRVGIALLLFLTVLGAGAAMVSYIYPSQTKREMDELQGKISGFLNPAHDQQPSVQQSTIGRLPSNSTASSDSVVGSTPSFPSISDETAVAHGSVEINSPDDSRTAHGVATETPVSRARAGNAANPSAQNRGTDNQAALILAQTYLANDTSAEQKAKGVQLLWLATEKGSTEAEIELANLYTEGIAVRKNCVQARILLKAAAAANAGAAESKLKEFDQSDCK